MSEVRKALFQQDLETPRGKLDGLWRRTMTLMSVTDKPYDHPFPTDNLHERICRRKNWADSMFGTTGTYPDAAVRLRIERIEKVGKIQR